MHARSRTSMVAIAATLLWALAASAAPKVSAPTPSVGQWKLGKWKLNVEKSKFEPGPGFKSEDRLYEDWGGGVLHGIFEAVDAEGKSIYREFAVRLDGRDYPWVVKGSPNAFTIALKPSGPRKWAYTTKKDGSVYQTGTNSVSDDGKVMTITFTGVSAQGKTPSGTMVFDKQ